MDDEEQVYSIDSDHDSIPRQTFKRKWNTIGLIKHNHPHAISDKKEFIRFQASKDNKSSRQNSIDFNSNELLINAFLNKSSQIKQKNSPARSRRSKQSINLNFAKNNKTLIFNKTINLQTYMTEKKKKINKNPLKIYQELLLEFQLFKKSVKQMLTKQQIAIRQIIEQIKKKVAEQIQNWKNIQFQIINQRFKIIKKSSESSKNDSALDFSSEKSYINTIKYYQQGQSKSKNMCQQILSDRKKSVEASQISEKFSNQRLRNMSPNSQVKFNNLFHALSNVKKGMNDLRSISIQKQLQASVKQDFANLKNIKLN